MTQQPTPKPRRTAKQHLLAWSGLLFVVVGLLIALGGVVVLFSDAGAGFSILLPGLVVAAVGSRLRGYGRGDDGVVREQPGPPS